VSEAAEVVEVPPAASKRIDLDAARAARAEAKRKAAEEAGTSVEDPHVILGGERYDLAPELPVGALTAFGALFAVAGEDDDDRVNLEALGSLEEAASSLFGEAWPKLKGHGLSFEDLEVLLDGALGAYGIELPNS
jgi:hypothetical protein